MCAPTSDAALLGMIGFWASSQFACTTGWYTLRSDNVDPLKRDMYLKGHISLRGVSGSVMYIA